MRFVLSTWGSTGDVQPFLVLARQLLKAGHEIRVCTSEISGTFYQEVIGMLVVSIKQEHLIADSWARTR